MKLSRRQFMQLTALGSASLAAPRLVFAGTGDSQNDDIIISIFLRGAADGLNIVPPWGDPDYYRLRPGLAIPEPGTEGGALALDELFGFHPGMQSLMPVYEEGDLAVIHACGSHSPSHSHFEAQDLMERGLEESMDEFNGWLGRYLDHRMDDSFGVFHAVAMGIATPRTLVHQVSTITMPDIESFSLLLPADQEDTIRELLQELYPGDSVLDTSSRDTLAAVEELAQADPLQYPPDNGAAYPDSRFGHQLQAMGQLIKADIGLRAGALSLGGWDTHEGEAATLDSLVPDLADSLAAFHADMDTRMSGITLVVMTEFGRRAYENGSAGTDHGHASFMLAMGKNVNGGVVYQQWPGLRDMDLYGSGDLEVTIDYRTVLAEMISQRTAGMPLEALFPGMPEYQSLGIFS
jgi:uncharacterized protein (DUF1501 family)